MNFYAIIEPLVRDKYWSNQYTEGIRQETHRIKGKYIEITFDNLNDVISYGESTDTRPIVIINCISNTWIPECLSRLEQMGIHPLLLTPVSRALTTTASTVSFDFYDVFYSLCEYLEGAKHGQIALFGLNPSSSNDIVKQQAFAQYYGVSPDEIQPHIFWNYGDLESCCSTFLKNVNQYNAVICANDIVAIKLISFLKNQSIDVPKDIYVATIGNTFLSKIIEPQITVAEFDCFAIGQQAVRVYNFLAKNPDISSLTATVSGQIIARESTDSIPPSKSPVLVRDHKDCVNFYADEDVKNILTFENLFKGIDDLDKQILNGMLCDKKYTELADELFTTESTIKYRVRRMLALVGCKTKPDLLKLLMQHINYFRIDDVNI